MNNYDTYLSTLNESIKEVEGELYKFRHDKIKKAAYLARKSLMLIARSATVMRKLIQEDVNAMPVIKKNISPKEQAEISEKRKATIEAKRNKRSKRNKLKG